MSDIITELDKAIDEWQSNQSKANERYQNNLHLDKADGQYAPAPETKPQQGVPKGSLKNFCWDSSTVFPDAQHQCSLYVPAQYCPETPAALIVFQDGPSFHDSDSVNATTVLDHLIHRGDVPVLLALFVDAPSHPGQTLPDAIPEQPRQQEYDSQNDHYARFLIEELIPSLSQQYCISDDPEQRAICGMSSGGMCAWTVGWQRPDQFRKIISFIGSFVDIHGGHNAAYQVRRTAKKPLRVFLQTGDNDLNIPYGNWPLANQTMASALAFADYDYRFVYGDGGHDLKHAAAIFPAVLRWLWRDWRDPTQEHIT